MLLDLFLVRFFFNLFVPCGGLSFLVHVKYTISYRIVCSVIKILRMNCIVRPFQWHQRTSVVVRHSLIPDVHCVPRKTYDYVFDDKLN